MKLLTFFLIFSCYALFSLEVKGRISAKSAILIDSKTGKVLFEKNAKDRFFPSSLTKIATVYYALETISDINQFVMPSENALIEVNPEKKHKNYNVASYILENDGTKMYGLSSLKKVPLKDLIYGAMLSSGNNATNVLAEAISGDILIFMEELNAFLIEKGLKNTHFKNPHGLHFPGHYSSAYDQAMLTRYAIKNQTFKEVMQTISYTSKYVNYEMQQKNKLLIKDSKYFYPKAFGVKTGYTSKAGYNLVAVAEDSNHSFIGVVLGCDKNNDRYNDMITLFDTFFAEEIVNEVIFSVNQVFEKELFGAKEIVRVSLKEDLAVGYYPSRDPQFEAFIEWTNVELPIKEGQIVGNLIIKDKDQELARAVLYSQNNVHKHFYKWLFNLIP